MRRILFLLLIAVLSACGDADKKDQGKPATAAPPAEVDVITVAAGAANLSQDLPGRLQATRSAQVRARVEGVIEKQLYVEGTDVAAGKPLFRIDTRTYQAQADAAQANMAAARAAYERYKPLLESKAVSQQEYDAALANYKQAESALAKARLDLENAIPSAPIAGRVGRALVTEGALVGKGDATPLTTVEQIDPIRVEFTQPYSDVLRLEDAIKPGRQKRNDAASVQLVLDDGTLYAHAGHLNFTDMAVDPTSGAILMRAQFPNPQRQLLPGAFVRVRFSQAQLDKAIRIPQRAVQGTPQGQNVMTVDSAGKVALRAIKTGAMSGSDFIVTEGLAEGDVVIVNGLQKVAPGAMVKPVPWNPGVPIMPAAAPTDAAKSASK